MMGEIDRSLPPEITALDVYRIERELDTGVLCFSEIVEDIGITGDNRQVSS